MSSETRECLECGDVIDDRDVFCSDECAEARFGPEIEPDAEADFVKCPDCGSDVAQTETYAPYCSVEHRESHQER